MKRNHTVAALAIALMLTACTAVNLYQPPSQPSICEVRPAIFVDSKSHICDVSLAMGMSPEQIDNLLLDATAMGYITNQVEKQQIAHFLDRTEQNLDPLCISITYDSFLDTIDAEAERSMLLKRIINRRLSYYVSTELISPFDCWMIAKAIEHQRAQFGLDDNTTQ